MGATSRVERGRCCCCTSGKCASIGLYLRVAQLLLDSPPATLPANRFILRSAFLSSTECTPWRLKRLTSQSFSCSVLSAQYLRLVKSLALLPLAKAADYVRTPSIVLDEPLYIPLNVPGTSYTPLHRHPKPHQPHQHDHRTPSHPAPRARPRKHRRRQVLRRRGLDDTREGGGEGGDRRRKRGRGNWDGSVR